MKARLFFLLVAVAACICIAYCYNIDASTVLEPIEVDGCRILSFGSSISYSDTKLAIGAPRTIRDDQPEVGILFVYDRNGTQLSNPRSFSGIANPNNRLHNIALVDDKTVLYTYNNGSARWPAGGRAGLELGIVSDAHVSAFSDTEFDCSAIDYMPIDNTSFVAVASTNISLFKRVPEPFGDFSWDKDDTLTIMANETAESTSQFLSLAYNNGRIACTFVSVSRGSIQTAVANLTITMLTMDESRTHLTVEWNETVLTGQAAHTLPGSVSALSPGGTVYAVGSPFMADQDGSYQANGRVDLYHYDGVKWVFGCSLYPDSESSREGAFFGASIVFKSDSELFISSPNWRYKSASAILLYTKKSAGLWVKSETIIHHRETIHDRFGVPITYIPDSDTLVASSTSLDRGLVHFIPPGSPSSNDGSGGGLSGTTVVLVVAGVGVIMVLLSCIILVTLMILGISAAAGASLAAYRRDSKGGFVDPMSTMPLVSSPGRVESTLLSGMVRPPLDMRLPPLLRPPNGVGVVGRSVSGTSENA
ncbi:WD40 superfamily [Carpediemonas membranifera]|uniref:WD40 superfamily n=1 Tax=Carpediemonas membranifera TaxID=201153 RepID=A0A8J6E6X9_9EUKA|nr:WD40 superfamily [Carpediemonas membranifera]|eukprot:KAG9397627.1 WD40 superfamily [Carpediemonas membranifera]